MPKNNLPMKHAASAATAASKWWQLPRAGTRSVALGLCAVGVLVAGVAWLSASRHYFGYGTETDFLGIILNDALAFANGQPMKVEYQPPLYPICAALLYLLTGDWFTAGRVLSLFSAAIVLVTSFFFYRFSVSKVAAWGAMGGLAISPLFIAFSTFATTDIFFLALYSTVLLLAYLSEQRSSIVLWCATGILLALALLTRANALTLVMVAIIPLFAEKQTWRARVIWFSSLIGGALIPLVTWGVYASVSNSNLWPAEGTTVNLALSYFRPYKGADWGSSVEFARSRFHSFWDVISYNPDFLIKSYLKDLYHLFEKTLRPNLLFAFPSNYFILPAIVYFFAVKQRKWMYYVLALTLAQALLVNFKTYDSRYYLFLLPFLGAVVAEFVRQIYWSRRGHSGLRDLVIVPILSMLLVIGLVQSGMQANAAAHRNEPELSESIPAAEKIMNSNSFLVARKPVLAYYSGADRVPMPQRKNVEELLAYVTNLLATKKAHDKELYIYYGGVERRLRPEYRKLLNVSSVKKKFSKLQLVAQSSDGSKNPWVLYRYKASHHTR